MNYDKNYYTNANYANYLEREGRYKKLAEEVYQMLHSFNLINKQSKILDYGCAVGHLLIGFLEIGCENVYGYDISPWAIEQSKSKNLKVGPYEHYNIWDIIIALDVLEHMSDEQIDDMFLTHTSNIILFRIPVAEPGETTFSLQISQQDPTHINCKTKNGWKKLLERYGYKTILTINGSTIYDSIGVFCGVGIKHKNDP